MAGITGRTTYGYPYGNYTGYQGTGYGWPMQQPGAPQPMMQQPAQPAQMSKPTVHADIIQVENEEAGKREPVDAGTSQMMITKDESAILIKSVLANGETTMDIYRKIPPETKPPEPEYITREEFEQRIAAMIRRAEPVREIYRHPDPGPAAEDDNEYGEDQPTVRRTTTRTAGGSKKQ